MKNIGAALAIISALVSFTMAQAGSPVFSEKDAVRVDASPKGGFSYPYYLYVPGELRTAADKRPGTILVLPNNTGKLDDDLAVHEADVKRRLPSAAAIASMLKVAVLMPVFPRPKSDWQTYVHAMDRDSMLTPDKQYRRPDLQTIAMIDDARARLRRDGMSFDKRVLINGFSAQAMFANRFTFLHPDRVKAAVVGSPGGWPIAPVATYKGKALRYPIGVADVKSVAGGKLDLKALRKIPILIYLGDKDDNDSVPFGDSYDDEDRELIMPLLGKTPIERWEISKQLYREAGLTAEFRLYPGIAHTVSPLIREDIVKFLWKYR